MEVEEYLDRSRQHRRLRSGPHGQLVERYVARLVEERLVRHGTWRCLNVVGGLLSWIAGRRYKLDDLDECQFASKRDPLFASNCDPSGVPGLGLST